MHRENVKLKINALLFRIDNAEANCLQQKKKNVISLNLMETSGKKKLSVKFI